jgi:hypothetical protein
MRGGSIPLLVWGVLLCVLMAICWIWTDDTIQVAAFGFAVLVIWGTAALFAGQSRRESVRRGPPPASAEPLAVPTASAGAVLLAVSVASIAFGFAFGRFLVYFGGGLLVVALALILLELSGQRRARRASMERQPR